MRDYRPKYGTVKEINGRLVYSDLRDEIRAFKFMQIKGDKNDKKEI